MPLPEFKRPLLLKYVINEDVEGDGDLGRLRAVTGLSSLTSAMLQANPRAAEEHDWPSSFVARKICLHSRNCSLESCYKSQYLHEVIAHKVAMGKDNCADLRLAARFGSRPFVD